MKVYKAIESVMRDIGLDGISKERKNQLQGYNFRGVDDVLNALNPLLAKHNLVVLPRVLERETVERQTAKGSAIFYTFVKCEFDFVSSEDGSKHTVSTFGEGMDSSDKSTNKAMSAAYKYAAFQTFCIPTVGADSEEDTHLPLPKTEKTQPRAVSASVATAPKANQDGAKNISEAQRKRLWALMKKAEMPEEVLRKYIAEQYKYESTKDIHYTAYEAICNFVESWKA